MWLQRNTILKMCIFLLLDKTAEDKEHEGMLIDQWVTLTEERNAILCPSSGSGVPGATMDWYENERFCWQILWNIF